MYTLPKLSYSYDGLKKAISEDIMRLHHQKHHQGYVDKLNKAVEKSDDAQSYDTVEDLLRNINKLPNEIQKDVRNNGGGHYNHSLFWQCMSPQGGERPAGDLYEAIIATFGSFEDFKDEFSSAGATLFGSGWVWLMPDMTIETTPNQDSPIMEGKPEPILGLDVWEHAFYLDYKNAKADYIAAWWDVVDWSAVEQRYHARKV